MIAIYREEFGRPLVGIAKNEIAARRFLMKQEMDIPCLVCKREKYGIETKDPYLMTPNEVRKYYRSYIWHSYIFKKIDVIH